MCLETLQIKCKKDNKQEERERERERENIAGLFGVSTTKELQESYCQLGATTKNS